MSENKEKIWMDRIRQFRKVLNELNIIEGSESFPNLDIQDNHFMEEINEIQSEIQRLKKIEKYKKFWDPVDFYDFSNLKRRK